MKKILICVIAIVVLGAIIAWLLQPFGIKANKKTTDQCTKDMQKYENVVCD